MKIAYDDLKEIFQGSELSLEFSDLRKRYGNIYCYVKYKNNSLCVLRNQVSPDVPITAEGSSYSNVFYGKNNSPMEKRNFQEIVVSNINDENKRKQLFQAFELDELTPYELNQLKIRGMKNKKISELLSAAPNYGTFYRNPVYMVNMREQLILDATTSPEFIGTMGLGPCIGVGLVSKKNGKIDKIGVAHIDALTDRGISDNKSINLFMYPFSNADEIYVTLISSGNEKDRAAEILQKLLYSDDLMKKAHVCSEIDSPSSFCINTKTGTLYKDIPTDCFINAKERTAKEEQFDVLRYQMPSGLSRSLFYDAGVRKSRYPKVQMTKEKSENSL